MDDYCMNANAQSVSGDYEVHNLRVGASLGCLPLPQNQILLGRHWNCQSAVAEAQRRYPLLASRIDGCAHCVPNCHRH